MNFEFHALFRSEDLRLDGSNLARWYYRLGPKDAKGGGWAKVARGAHGHHGSPKAGRTPPPPSSSL